MQVPSPDSGHSSEGYISKGDAYDARWRAMAAAGEPVHGEVDFLCSLVSRCSVLDAGCGTGRVAIELVRRDFDVVGVDLNPAMLATAQEKAVDVEWHLGDLAALDLGRTFDLIVMAGNVMIFVSPGTEGAVLSRLATHLTTGGLLVAGFQLGPDRLSLADYDALAEKAGLRFVERWGTWDRQPFAGGDYAVSVHEQG